MPAGRPKIEIDLEELKRIMRFKPSLITTAGYFDVTEKCIQRRIKDHFDLNFVQFRDKYMAKVRIKLVHTALEQAFSGNTPALIFCLKNLCGWADKQETEINTGENAKLIIDLSGDVKDD